MKRILYSCPFVPAEWIGAHGCSPWRVAPASSEAPFIGRMGICPYAEAFAKEAVRTEADAVVMTTVCDQMRRIWEHVSKSVSIPVFLMHVPHTADTTESFHLYRDELLRLGRMLVRLGGADPSEEALGEAMLRWEDARNDVLALQGRVSASGMARALMELHRGEPETALPFGEAAPNAKGLRIAVLGGPLAEDDFGFFDAIEERGARVVLNGTANGERTLPGEFDRRRLHEHPLDELVDAYFGRIPDAFRRPNGGLYRWIRGELAARDVQGLIVRRYLWCDTWHAEAQRLKEWCPVPVLAIDVEDGDTVGGRTMGRIEAFLEMVR